MNVMIQARVNEHTKKEAEKILNQLGLSLSDGLRMFLHQVTINRGMPFRPVLDEEPNERVQEAMRNAQDYISGRNKEGFKSFSSVDDLMSDLMSEDDE